MKKRKEKKKADYVLSFSSCFAWFGSQRLTRIRRDLLHFGGFLVFV